MSASAKGLFSATGNKSRPTVRMLDGELQHVDDALEREADDFYPTPPAATRAFLHAEIDRLRDFDGIWEPAAGNGAMLREMESLDLNCFGTDLVDRGAGVRIVDFYDITSPIYSAIVTNPPFQECGWGNGKARWLKHALDVLDVEYMALLLNWTWPGAGGLGPFWADHPASRAYLMRWKIDFTGQGAPPMLNAWFVWDKKHSGETFLRMLDRKDARQAELFGSAA